MNLGRKAWALVLVVAAVWACAASGCGNDGGCADGDRTYEDGDRWICPDGCNHCGCVDGDLVTTAMWCGPWPEDGAAGAGDELEQ